MPYGIEDLSRLCRIGTDTILRKQGYVKAIEKVFDEAVDLDESFALTYNTKGYTLDEIYGEYQNVKE